MAHTFGSTVLARSSASTSPITRAATTSAGDTVLVLFVEVKGATDRAGGAPTWNGVSGVQANSTQKAAASPEAGVEVWYWTGAVLSGTGSLFIGSANIVIPNTGGLTIFSAAYTGRAASGFTSLFNAAAGSNGTSANPTTTNIAGTITGDIIFAACASGAQTFAPSARTGTSLYETDDGATGGGGQYLIQTGSGAQAMTWTQASDDWGAVGVAFREAPVMAPSPGTLSVAGTVSALAFAFSMAAGSLALAGQAPTVSVGGGDALASPAAAALTLTGHAPTVSDTRLITIPSGSLVFKGPARGSESVSLPIGAGSLALSGQAPSLRYDLVAAPAAGTLSLTGIAPTVLDGKLIEIGTGALVFKGPARAGTITLAPEVGTLSLAGHAPSTVVDRPIAIGAGSLTFEGQYVGIAFQGPDVGQLVLTGYAPTVNVAGGTNTNISIDAGALVLTGLAPALTVNHIASPAAGSLALVGLAPSSVTNHLATPASGALTLQGLAPSALQNHIAATDAGTLTLTGYGPSLLGQGQLSPDAAVLTLTGHAPTLLTAFVVPIAQGTLSLTGQTPSLSFGLAIGAGTLTLQGYVPTLSSAGQTSPDAGALVLTGYAPQAFVAHVAAPGVGTLTLTGQAPTLAEGITEDPAAGTLTLIGLAPTLQFAYVLSPGAGTLTLTGPAPELGYAAYVAAPDTGILTLQGYAPIATAQIPPTAHSVVIAKARARVVVVPKRAIKSPKTKHSVVVT